MAYTALQVSNAVWTATTRTLAAGSATVGTTPAGKTADAIWNYSTRTLTSAVATALVFTGPTSGTTGIASTNYTVSLFPSNGTVASPVTVTPATTGSGTFSPATVSLTTASPSATFTYTPSTTGTYSLSITNNGSLTNPGAISYTSASGVVTATAITLTGSAAGLVGSPSQPFTVLLFPVGGSVTGTVTVTPSSTGGGTFSPTTLSLTTASPSGTFTYTDSVSHTSVISLINTGGLSNPSGFSYTTSTSNITVTTFSAVEHSITINLGTIELLLRHLSDVNISAIRVSSGTENAQDTTGLPVIISN